MVAKYLLFAAFFFISCSSLNKRNNDSSNISEVQQLRKDYAFCKCLEYSFGTKVADKIKELDFTQGMLFDIGDLGNVYPLLDSIALDFSKKIPASQISDFENAKPITFKCLEFHRSKELDTFVRSLR